MGSAIGLREDFDAASLRRLARGSNCANQARRRLSLSEIYDGGTRTSAARIGAVGLQIVRDWVVRFNALGPAGLLDRKALGSRSRLADVQQRALAQVVESGPIPAIHGVVRWRLVDLPSPLGRDMRIVPVLHRLDEDTVAILGSNHLVQILHALIDLDSAPMAFERVV